MKNNFALFVKAVRTCMADTTHGVLSISSLCHAQIERRYQSRVYELQDKLDRANSTKKSMESYVSFLKSSYASVFNDTGQPSSPLIH